ncbi:hypothetical protein GCM10029976_090770 [Kribbella albertanoniae]|uniref:Uncharacterized protein n=1 Tax=Kribbella albertanoniae TaxID=1266829 RepID=A0A4R4PJE3_9ACTN|nr:hypothetical protein [Kribbella albertanoniae]TDC22147.1 hypothetical protein E1261_31655 [Kribbella albertanoniae]
MARQKKSVTADTSVWDDIAELARVNRRYETNEAGIALEVYVHLSKTEPDLLRRVMADLVAPTS